MRGDDPELASYLRIEERGMPSEAVSTGGPTNLRTRAGRGQGDTPRSLRIPATAYVETGSDDAEPRVSRAPASRGKPAASAPESFQKIVSQRLTMLCTSKTSGSAEEPNSNIGEDGL